MECFKIVNKQIKKLYPNRQVNRTYYISVNNGGVKTKTILADFIRDYKNEKEYILSYEIVSRMSDDINITFEVVSMIVNDFLSQVGTKIHSKLKIGKLKHLPDGPAYRMKLKIINKVYINES